MVFSIHAIVSVVALTKDYFRFLKRDAVGCKRSRFGFSLWKADARNLISIAGLEISWAAEDNPLIQEEISISVFLFSFRFRATQDGLPLSSVLCHIELRNVFSFFLCESIACPQIWQMGAVGFEIGDLFLPLVSKLKITPRSAFRHVRYL